MPITSALCAGGEVSKAHAIRAWAFLFQTGSGGKGKMKGDFLRFPGMSDEHKPISRQDRVRLVRIQAFFENARGNPFSFMLGGVLLFAALHGTGSSEELLWAWLLLLLLTSGMTFLCERHVKHVGLTLANADRFYRIRILTGSLACALCGAVVGFLPLQAAEPVHAFVFIILSSVAGISYMTYATAFSYGLAVNALVLIPLTVFFIQRYVVVGDRLFLLLGLTSVLWQFLMIAKALRIARAAIETIVSAEQLHAEMAERVLVQGALKASQEESQQLASMLRLMCDNVPDMIWAKDLEGRYTFANLTFCERLLGVSDTAEPVGKTYEYFAQRERDRHPEDHEWFTFGQYSLDIHRHTLGRDEPTVYEESGNVRGEYVFLDIHQARFKNAQGEVIGTVGSARDITERKASEAFVQHLAHHDALTDLPNRILLNDRLRQAIALARRDRGRLAVLFIDLDRLKPVNDTLGHDIGDLLLKEVARRLLEVVTREADTAARLGGDEFVVLLQRVNKEQDAVLMAKKILTVLNQPFTVFRHEISISACVGIALYPQHGDDGTQLLKNADAAMYEAKRAGRNAYRVFDGRSVDAGVGG
jgi:diguanylate cyclase (GGDEF)-like protein/PAS domain S-box-containing protein